MVTRSRLFPNSGAMNIILQTNVYRPDEYRCSKSSSNLPHTDVNMLSLMSGLQTSAFILSKQYVCELFFLCQQPELALFRHLFKAKNLSGQLITLECSFTCCLLKSTVFWNLLWYVLRLKNSCYLSPNSKHFEKYTLSKNIK